MVEALFLQLYGMIGSASLGVVALAALLWGIASILLSPCHLASIPLVIACVGGRQPQSLRLAALLSLLFAGGILVSIAAVGGATVAAGRLAGDLGLWGNLILGLLFIVFGLNLFGIFAIPWFNALSRPGRTTGAAGAFVTGALLGMGLGPCTFAFLAPVLGLAFSLAATRPLLSGALLGLFALGHCAVIAAAGVSAEGAQRLIQRVEAGRWVPLGKRLFGAALVLLGGFYLLAVVTG